MNRKGFAPVFVIVLVALVVAGGIWYFGKLHTAPSTLIPANSSGAQNITLNPNNFTSINLENASSSNYVKSGGEVKTSVVVGGGQRVWMVIEKISPPKDNISLPFVYYALYPSGQYNFPPHMKLEPTGNGNYLFKFPAPPTPGEYQVIFSEPFRKEYKLTVIDNVLNGDAAIKIAERFVFSKVADNIKDWHVVSKNASLQNDAWNVEISISYGSCGIDWNANVCSEKSVGGKYVIDKTTGQIVK